MMPWWGAALSSKSKASRLIGSDCREFCSDALRNCEMPLGAAFTAAAERR